MADGEWATRARAKESREAARAADRRLKIEWADKLWLAQNHPCDDAILAWLSEHRAEASKIGASRWNLETLPGLHDRQRQLRQAAAFQAVLDRASISRQTLTVDQVLSEARRADDGGFPQNPQNQPMENKKRRADAGKARKRTSKGAA